GAEAFFADDQPLGCLLPTALLCGGAKGLRSPNRRPTIPCHPPHLLALRVRCHNEIGHRCRGITRRVIAEIHDRTLACCLLSRAWAWSTPRTDPPERATTASRETNAARWSGVGLFCHHCA